jgi:hypothetical protein
MKRYVLGLLLGCVPAVAGGQDVEPRAMTPAPVGTNFVGLALAHSRGAVLLDKTIPVEDLDGKIYSLLSVLGCSLWADPLDNSDPDVLADVVCGHAA